MRSIIFSNYSAFDTRRLGATIDVEHSHLRFLGNMSLNLWDCGGQDVFMDNYFTNQKDHIFKMVEVLIHVFDVESKEVGKDIEVFVKSLKQLKQFSPNAKIFVLLHKMDLVQIDRREELFGIMMNRLNETSQVYGFNVTGFATSIWDESLYKAWSSIVCSLIPNMNQYETNLSNLQNILEAQEIILFEKTTFLVICSSNSGNLLTNDNNNNENFEKLDPKRFEKISNIMKNFKQSSTKLKSQFRQLNLNNNLFITELSSNLMIFVVLPFGINNNSGLIQENIKQARKYFQ
ncbi:Ras-related GTP-binding protein A [Wickerhamomyces ciferrii]|uniref:GTP-binding protein n=1 Tax=Wickerhamomyces ciferrii (strain ATCC 14091 / BCRC 22168 / CBS 111 / JCM 3599 / NBRC 0793 / NRRL Y-1031 F-60-10) TaxID=1206466 RepID=K0KU57_WICCF|nr:Ras-related GTP-binding protein A [Wickerhamomyces ciferrii]CCH44954.1 Ras-related GTP-binding protein A [Wickerhamomyces ciferrii]